MNDLEKLNDRRRFEAALKAMEKIRAMIQLGNFNKDTFSGVEVLDSGVSMSEVYRAGIAMNVVAISENLLGIKNPRNWHEEVPQATFKRVRDMRNLIGHQYGHAEKTVDWDDVWEYIENDRNAFVPQLEKAVARADKDLSG